MNGALTYPVAVVHQAELRAAAEPSRRAARKPRRERRLPLPPGARRQRRAYA
jgi:hypothetical protein